MAEAIVNPLHFVVGVVAAAISLAVASRARRRVLRRWLISASVAFSLTPTIVAGGHGAGVAPVWYAFVYYLSDDPIQVAYALGLGVLPAVVVGIVLYGLIAVCSAIRRRLREPR